MKSYIVIAEFVDRETGQRVRPAPDGAEPMTFTPHDEDQAERLVKAGCLGKGEAAKPADPDPAGIKPAKPAARGRARR